MHSNGATVDKGLMIRKVARRDMQVLEPSAAAKATDTTLRYLHGVTCDTGCTFDDTNGQEDMSSAVTQNGGHSAGARVVLKSKSSDVTS